MLPVGAPLWPRSALERAESRLEILLSGRDGRRGGCTEYEVVRALITTSHYCERKSGLPCANVLSTEISLAPLVARISREAYLPRTFWKSCTRRYQRASNPLLFPLNLRVVRLFVSPSSRRVIIHSNVSFFHISMANNDSEDDNFFGTEIPLLESYEHARPPNVAGPPANVARPPTNAGQPPSRALLPSRTLSQPTANASRLPPRANFQLPANIGQHLPRVVFQHTANASRIPVRVSSRPPAQARPPENVGRARRNLLNRVLPPPGLEATEEEIAERRLRQQFDPLDSRLAQQAALDRTITRPNLGDTLSQPLSRRTSILEGRSLSLASASPYTEIPESDHTHPRSTPFPTWSSQLPIRPRLPLPPRRNLRLGLQTPTPPVGPRNQVRQGFVPYRNPSQSAVAQSIVTTPPIVTHNFVIQNPSANTQAQSTPGLDQSPAYTSENIPNADSANQGSPPETASSSSALDEAGPGPSENPPCDNLSLEPEESSEEDPERTSRDSCDDDNSLDQGSTHEGASGPGAPDQGGLDKGGESPPRDGLPKENPSVNPSSDVPYLN